MTKEIIKLMRSPVDTECLDCGESVDFGVYTHFNGETGEAICIECGVKRGWTDKARVKQLIKKLELQTDIKALVGFRTIELRTLNQLKTKIQIYKLAEKHHDLEQKVLVVLETVTAYLKQCGDAQEKEFFEKMFDALHDVQDLQNVVQREVENRLYMVDRSELRERRKKKKVVAQEKKQ